MSMNDAYGGAGEKFFYRMKNFSYGFLLKIREEKNLAGNKNTHFQGLTPF
jgi:hypothetical protein